MLVYPIKSEQMLFNLQWGYILINSQYAESTQVKNAFDTPNLPNIRAYFAQPTLNVPGTLTLSHKWAKSSNIKAYFKS